MYVKYSEYDLKMNVDKEKDEKEIIMLKGVLKEKVLCIFDLMYFVEDFKVF